MLQEAFDYLKEGLVPEEDEFDAAACFRQIAWTPGERVQDLFARYLEESVRGKYHRGPRASLWSPKLQRRLHKNSRYTNLPKVFVQHKITLVVNVPLWTNIKSGAMMGIKIFKYRKHTLLGLTLVKI